MAIYWQYTGNILAIYWQYINPLYNIMTEWMMNYTKYMIPNYNIMGMYLFWNVRLRVNVPFIYNSFMLEVLNSNPKPVFFIC